MASIKARELRIFSTDAERRLWSALRTRRLENYKFRRQHPVGPFILDFACVEHRLVIEADGGQHDENLADERRTAWLASKGWRVRRFWNNEILTNIEGFMDTIFRELERKECRRKHPHPPNLRLGPSLSRFRGRGAFMKRVRPA